MKRNEAIGLLNRIIETTIELRRCELIELFWKGTGRAKEAEDTHKIIKEVDQKITEDKIELLEQFK